MPSTFASITIPYAVMTMRSPLTTRLPTLVGAPRVGTCPVLPCDPRLGACHLCGVATGAHRVAEIRVSSRLGAADGRCHDRLGVAPVAARRARSSSCSSHAGGFEQLGRLAKRRGRLVEPRDVLQQRPTEIERCDLARDPWRRSARARLRPCATRACTCRSSRTRAVAAPACARARLHRRSSPRTRETSDGR